MTTLPPELAPWAPLLAALAPDLQPEVGRLARRIEAAIGPLRPRRPEPGGEPDGYRGIDRRGPYDRLLLSEWAYLDEVPDEFIRRAASREQAYYQLDHRSPRGGMSCHAVFDAGPGSVGLPRIVHVAMLVVLARRATEAGAEFSFRVAQRPTLVHRQVSGTTLRAVLASRSAQPFAVPPGLLGHDELWFVGGEAVRNAPGHLALVEEVLEPGESQLDVTFSRPRRSPSTLRLAAPPSPVRRRLVTDPCPPAAGRRVDAPRSDPLWRNLPLEAVDPARVRFYPGTSQLFCYCDNGTVLAWSLAKVPAHGVPKPRIDSMGLEPNRVALGWYQQRFLSVRLHEREVIVWGRGINWRLEWAGLAPAPGGTDAFVVVPPDSAERSVFFIDGEERLWRADDKGLELLGEGCTAIRPASSGVLSAWRRGDGTQLRITWPLGTHSEPMLVPGERPLFGREYPWSHPQNRIFEVGEQVTTALVHPHYRGDTKDWETCLATRAELPLPPGEIVGCAFAHHGEPEPKLQLVVVAWNAGEGAFVRYPDGARLHVPRTPLGAQLDDSGERVAFITPEKTVELWGFEGERPLMLRDRPR